MCPGVGLEGWIRRFANRLGGDVCSGQVQYPAFATGSSKVAVEEILDFFFFFWSLLSRICPSCTCTQLFLVPNSFFVSCCSRRGVSRCKH